MDHSFPMPRKLRVEYPGAIYHLLSRGNRKENIFRSDVDRQDFLKTLAETCLKTGWQVHAYCLMGNHFHLVVETPNADLVAGMRWLLSTFTIRLNHRHKLTGHVFGGRYKALIVDGSGNGYLKSVCDYVHLNPVRAGLLAPGERLLAYPWSSFGGYLCTPAHRPGWLRVDRALGEHGILEDSVAGRLEFEQRLEARRESEANGPEWQAIRRSWCLGSPAFRQELLDRMGPKLAEPPADTMRRESAIDKAERIVVEELGVLGWTDLDLQTNRKSDPRKMAIAARLRRETTLSVRVIAARLSLGSPKSANALLHKWLRRPVAGEPGVVVAPKP